MIDNEARSYVRQAVDAYLSDRLTAFEFDERLLEARGRTSDPTVRFVIDQLWYVYDDCQDHLVCLGKESWDTIQRLMLLLDSGGEIRTSSSWKYHASQAVAALTLLAMVLAYAWEPGAWAIPVLAGGVVSILLGTWRGRKVTALAPADPWRAWPFQSLAALHTALKRAPKFHKRRHRPEAAQREIRSSADSRCMHLHFLFTWCHYSPLPLLAQCLPLRIWHAGLILQRKRSHFVATLPLAPRMRPPIP
jgi:hypothetical protein